MAYAFFKVPAEGGVAADELNRFIRSHPVAKVTRQWLEAGVESGWAFCVEHADGPPGSGKTAKIDYREILPPEQFEVYARLRNVRKELAEKDGTPVFAVFTNEQLAEMVRRECRTEADLKKITGLGEQKISKYGAAVLAELKKPASTEAAT